jgi:hypothetical protein
MGEDSEGSWAGNFLKGQDPAFHLLYHEKWQQVLGHSRNKIEVQNMVYYYRFVFLPTGSSVLLLNIQNSVIRAKKRLR